MRRSPVILILIPILAACQSVSFKTIQRKTGEYWTVSYPVVKYHDNQIEGKINAFVDSTLLGERIENRSEIYDKIAGQYGEGYNLHHSVTYNKDHVLSFSVFIEACLAHCSSYTIYFNFDLLTGEPIYWYDLVRPEMKDSFGYVLIERIKKDLSEYAREEVDRTAETDSTAVDWVKETYESCLADISISGLIIYPDKIEFEDQCDFPHAMRAYGPPTLYQWSAEDLAPYLKPRFLSLIEK